jgi:hypothetical protein
VKDNRATNKTHTTQRTPLPDRAIRKVPATSVPFGESITRRGGSVWCAYLHGELVGTAASAPEARRMYRAAAKKGLF